MRSVPIDLGLTLRVRQDCRAEELAELVRGEVLPRFFARLRPGDTVHLPALTQSILATPGVESVTVGNFSRRGAESGVADGALAVKIDELAVPGSTKLNVVRP